MKKIARISKDYESYYSQDKWTEDLKVEMREVDVYISLPKDRENWGLVDLLQTEQNTFADQYSNCVHIQATGYVQGSFLDYKIYYNGDEDKLKYLKTLLKRTFTHKNDYIVENIEMLPSGHSKIIDKTSFCVNDVEFPKLEDIKNAIEEHEGYAYDEFQLINN
tara:strand:- start:2579 stop:3067 length:489 start_codon:yes stop_codon:yes gene_type:complete